MINDCSKPPTSKYPEDVELHKSETMDASSLDFGYKSWQLPSYGIKTNHWPQTSPLPNIYIYIYPTYGIYIHGIYTIEGI